MAARLLLTGGAGSIGSSFIAYFLENTDWDIVTIDSFHHKGYRSRLHYLEQTYPSYADRVVAYQHDLVCPITPELQDEIGHVDYILHLAALSDVFLSVENPAYVIKNNVESTLTMLEYARAVRPLAFNYFSTDESLGPVARKAEGELDAHHEHDPHRPSNAYAASKAACEDICYAYWRSYGLPIFVTRTMNNFDIMQSSSKFPVIVQNAVQRGKTVTIHGNETEIGTRYYIQSKSAASALHYILQYMEPYVHKQGVLDTMDTYHVVGERAVSNLEMAQLVAQFMEKPLNHEVVDFHRDNPAHDIHYGLQDNYLRAAGWEQPNSFEESLKEVVEWQKTHPEWT